MIRFIMRNARHRTLAWMSIHLRSRHYLHVCVECTPIIGLVCNSRYQYDWTVPSSILSRNLIRTQSTSSKCKYSPAYMNDVCTTYFVYNGNLYFICTVCFRLIQTLVRLSVCLVCVYLCINQVFVVSFFGCLLVCVAAFACMSYFFVCLYYLSVSYIFVATGLSIFRQNVQLILRNF